MWWRTSAILTTPEVEAEELPLVQGQLGRQSENLSQIIFVAQVDFKLRAILLPPFLKFWEDKCKPPNPALKKTNFCLFVKHYSEAWGKVGEIHAILRRADLTNLCR